MTELDLIVDALVAGSTAGLSSTASGAVQDVYSGFKNAVHRHLRDRGRGEERVLAPGGASAEQWRERLRTVLAGSDIAGQPQILLSARTLLELVAHGERAPRVDLRGAKGVINGDNALQINTF